MSQAPNSKGKDVGKPKYASLNINQTFKGTKKVDAKAAGQPRQHGFQTLGKVAQTRRVPQPANLPSLKKENLGNDPRIALVPTGSQGWGAKDRQTPPQKMSDPAPPPGVSPVNQTTKTTQKPGDSSAEISLRPNAGVAPSLKTSGNLRDSAKPASWINKMQTQQPTGSATYFHREFPKLGGGEDKDGGGSGKDTTGEKSQGAGADMQLKISGSPVPLPEFQATHEQQRAMFNGPGQHGSYPYPGYMYPPPGPGARNFPMPPFPYSFPYQSGKMPGFDPNFARMPKPAFNPPPPRNEMPERPSIIKDTELNSLDADSEDNGWAGAQEEVDYNAKLKFDESDESDDDRRPVSKAIPLSKAGPGSRTGQNDDESSTGRQNQKDENNKQEWSDRQPDFSSKMPQAPPMDPQNWPRPPFPQPFGARGPPMPPFPYQPMYLVLNYPPPQQQQQQQQPQQQQQQQQSSLIEQQTESQSSTSSKLKTSRLNSEDDKVAMERKAAAQRRLAALEEKIKHREKVGTSEQKTDAKLSHSPDREPAGHEGRLRHDSEASDSSRKSFKMNKEVPPRFRRQMSGQPMDSAAPPAVFEEMPHSLSQTQETGPLRIMKRHDSAKSEDGGSVPPPVVTLSQPSANEEVVFKKPEVPVEKAKPIFTNQKDRASSARPVDGSTEPSFKESRHSSVLSAQSDQRVDARERTGSASSLSSLKGGRDGRDYGKRDSEARDGRKKLEREGRDRSDLDKKSDQRQPSDAARPKDDVDRTGPKKMEKLTRGNARSEKTYEKEDSHRKPVEKQQTSSGKAFPWAKVVSGERENGEQKVKDAVGSANTKSLRDIQKEEEEVEKAKEIPVESEGLGTEPSEKGIFEEQAYRGRDGGSRDYGDRRNRRNDRDSRFEEHDVDKGNRKAGNDSRPFDGRDRPRYNDRRRKFDSDRRDYRQDDKPEFERRGGYGRNREFNSVSRPFDFIEDRGDEARNDRRGDMKDDRRGDMRDDRRGDMRDDRRGDMRDDGRGDMRDDRRGDVRDDRRGDVRDDRRGDVRDDRRGVTREDRRGESKDGGRVDEARDGKRGEAKDSRVDEVRDDKQGDVRDDKQCDVKDDRRGERRDDKRGESRDDKRGESRDDKRGESRDGRRREGRDDRRGEMRDEKRGEGKGDRRERVDRREDRYERRDVPARREESGKEKREDRIIKDERGDRRADRRAERSDNHDEFRNERRVDREKRTTRPDKPDRKGYDDGRDSRSDRRDRRDDAYDDRRERAAERFDKRKDCGAREGKFLDQRDDKRAEREAGRASRGALDRDCEGTERKHDSGMRRRDEWSNRDYRQSEDYKRDIIEHEDRKKSEAEKSSEAKPGQDSGGQAAVPVKSADRTDKSYKDVVQANDDGVGGGGAVQQVSQRTASNILVQSIDVKSMVPRDLDAAVIDAQSALAGPRISPQLQREASAVTELTTIPQEALAVEAEAEVSTAGAVPCESENNERDVRNSSEVSIADGPKNSNKEFRKNRSFDRYEVPGERHESRGRGRFTERGRTSGRPRERGRGRGSGSYSGAFKEKDNDRGDPGSRQRPATGGYGRASSNREKENIRFESADGDSESSNVTDLEFAAEDGSKSRPGPKHPDLGEVKRLSSVESRKWENERPPRFQQQYQQQRSSDGRGGRGSSRSRGRGAFDRGRGFERGRGRGRRQSSDLYVSSGAASVVVPKPEVVDGDDQRVDDDSDCFFSADEVTPEEGENDSAKDRPARVASLDSKREVLSSRSRGSRIRESSHRGRGKRLLSRGRGRGGLQVAGSKSSDSFLVIRQQVGEEMNRVKGQIALPAADKSKTESKAAQSTSSSNVQPRSTVSRKSLDIEEISEHSPPKKYKPIEKKRDILKEYDLNDIASVVCVDDLMQSIDVASGMSATEDDGFVKVTSKKHTKELRDRQREEEKRKLLLEQQQQQREAAQAASRARKVEVAREKESAKENGPAIKSKVSAFSDTPMSTSVVDPATVAVTSVTVSLPLPQTSNAAMAAIGVWEPAQSLMRTSQQANTDGKMSPGSGLPSTGANAWQRPLSLATAAVHSSVTVVLAPLPDPKAVGTGKPSSQHHKAPSSSVVHSEVPSPLISPPALPLIGIVSGSVGKSANVPVHVADHGPSGLELKAVAESEIVVEDSRDVKSSAPVAKEERYNDSLVIEAADGLPDAKRPAKRTGKLINKKIMRETPPRFQTSQYKQQLQQQQSSNRKSDSRSDRVGDDSLSRKRSADRDPAVVSKALLDKTIKPPPKRIGSGGSVELDVPSLNGDISKSLLSDADKVVGANKPVAPPSEGLDHRSLISEKMQKRHASVEDGDKVKDTVHTKSSSDEDDRTLETRSLPGTPPLLVKIPEPSLSGPSSDPGRAPSPNVMVSISSHIALEMNEMSRRLLFARKAWDDTPSSTWSESTMASSQPGGLEVTLPASKGEALMSVDMQSGQVGADVEKSVVNPSSPTKVDSVVAVHASKAMASTHVEKPTATIAQNSFVSKREHQSQNNVCKVKPQQLHAIDTDSLSTGVTYSESRAPVSLMEPVGIAFNQQYSSVPYLSSGQLSKVQAPHQRYVLSLDQRQRQQAMPSNLQQPTIYSTDSFYGDLHTSQTLGFQSYGQQPSSSTQQPELVQQSLLLGNIYGAAGPLQPAQSQLLRWQVVSTPSVVPSSNTAYESRGQQSLFTGAGALSNPALVMPYNTRSSETAFSPQRISHQLVGQQAAAVGMLFNQQPQHAQHSVLGQPTGIFSMLQPDQLSGAQNLHAHSSVQPHAMSSSSGHIPLMLDPSQGMLSAQHMDASGQRSDLTKHVNAKPFEPNISRTPPSLHSPPAVNHAMPVQNQLPNPQVSAIRGIGSHSGGRHDPSSQPLTKQSSSPLVASVRPRAAHAQSIASPSPPLSVLPAQSLGTVSPIDPSFAVLASVLGYKGAPIPTQNGLQQSFSIQQVQGQQQHVLQPVPARFTHQMMTGGRPFAVRQGSPLVVRQRAQVPVGPGPIQRPSTIVAAVPQVVPPVRQPSTANVPPAGSVPAGSGLSQASQAPTISQSSEFRSLEHRRMIEETKRYFKEELHPTGNPSLGSSKSEKLSSVNADKSPSDGVSPEKESSERKFIDPATSGLSAPVPQRKR